ncbi:MAG: xylulokinase [Pseudomonadota bacterium]
MGGYVFLGIDIGTSGVKVVAMTPDSRISDSATAPLVTSRPKTTWSEQNPEDWWAATNRAVLQLAPEVRAQIGGIGLTGQMHGATLLDAQDRPLRPAILWNDGRSHVEASHLQHKEVGFLDAAGNTVMPGFTAPKLEWVRRHEPEIFEATVKVLLPKDYVRLCLSGAYASDMSDSAGTLWLDIERRAWHEPLLSACGLSLNHMPELYEGTQATGSLLPGVASDWGMARVPIFAGGGDNAAGAAAVGVINPGQTLMSLGTSGVIFTATDGYRAAPASGVHSFCHAVPGRWHLMSVMLSAASCLDWACTLTGTSTAADLIELAETTKGKPVSELFLPYLSGERTPHNDPHAKGVLFGVTHDTGPAELAQAVLEGVAFGMADGSDALMAAGATIDSFSVVGGGVKASLSPPPFAP